ncbi:Uncharacterized membrane protein YdjX, TVP38/TMEM64 family, SNARE-associated domain [Vreelandella subterranea]|uniref:Uncharacterized membrane protein YdjX, TVP38/TMEM64 family, SNARE-associated domain n=1 Tax=Vreelandella subterranea TaxID=416874 RepID=A0A1H9WCW4_9GAMM|nr:VTT domain-containing protein [Halomonas subterranea]SES31740.1 Uncharacterized membrane protein YdjX, TVP38/TMEM64 family, SNARE-associated domain [Halomonas subterranea]
MFKNRLLSRTWRWVAIGAMLLMVSYVWMWHPPEVLNLRRWVGEAPNHPLVIGSVILIMAVTLGIGLPGGIGLWLIAPFYAPLAATPMLIVGSVAGALGAYYLSTRFGDRWTLSGRAYGVLKQLETRSDFLTQCALRVLPGFPHAIINFAGGLLRLPLMTFVMAALIGLGMKWAVYASAIYGTLETVEKDKAIGPSVVLPLIALTLLLLAGAWFRRKSYVRHDSG